MNKTGASCCFINAIQYTTDTETQSRKEGRREGGRDASPLIICSRFTRAWAVTAQVRGKSMETWSEGILKPHTHPPTVQTKWEHRDRKMGKEGERERRRERERTREMQRHRERIGRRER